MESMGISVKYAERSLWENGGIKHDKRVGRYDGTVIKRWQEDQRVKEMEIIGISVKYAEGSLGRKWRYKAGQKGGSLSWDRDKMMVWRTIFTKVQTQITKETEDIGKYAEGTLGENGGIKQNKREGRHQGTGMKWWQEDQREKEMESIGISVKYAERSLWENGGIKQDKRVGHYPGTVMKRWQEDQRAKEMESMGISVKYAGGSLGKNGGIKQDIREGHYQGTGMKQ